MLLCWMKDGTFALESLPVLCGMGVYMFVYKAKPKEAGLPLPLAQQGPAAVREGFLCLTSSHNHLTSLLRL